MSKKLFSIKKRILFPAVFGCILLLMILFRGPLFRLGVETYLGAKYPTVGGWKFSYESIDWSSDRIRFKDVSIYSKEAFVTAYLNQVDLLLADLKKFTLGAALSLDRPQITIYKTNSDREKSLHDTISTFLISRPLMIHQAEIKLVDGSETIDVYLSLDADEKSNSIGTFYLSDKSDLHQSPHIMTKLYKWPKEIIIESELEEANLPWMAKVYNFFQSSEKKYWDISDGLVGGHLWVAIKPDSTITQTNSDLYFSNLVATHEKNGLTLISEELNIDFSYPGGKRYKSLQDTWWQNIALKSEVKGGKLSFKDPKSRVDFALCDLTGNVNLSTFRESEIDLRGYLDQHGQISPIVLGGSPSVIDKDTLDLDLKLLLEPEFQNSAHLNVSISMQDEGDCIVRGRLRDMGIEQIAMFQHVIGFASPEVKDFHLERGTVTCELSVRIGNNRIDKLLLENMCADDLQVHWVNHDILASCSHLEGSAQLDFQLLPVFQFPSWDITLKDGDLVIGRDEGTPVNISDINLELFMCRDVFEPSWGEATYEGVNTRFDIVGYYPEADFKVRVNTTADRVLSFFVPGKDGITAFSNDKVSTEMHLRRQLGYWDVNGDASLRINDLDEDRAKFGFYLSDRILKFEEKELIDLLRTSVSKGWFTTGEISCDFIKYVNYCSDNPWEVQGRASLEGTFGSDQVFLNVTTSDFSLYSEFVDVQLNGKENSSSNWRKPSEGSFHYSLHNNRWEGKLPLSHVQVTEKTMGLVFEDSSMQLSLNGKRLYLNDISTDVEGLNLKGDLTLKFYPGEGVTLYSEVKEADGSFKELEAFLNHFPAYKFDSMPFDGKVGVGAEGFRFSSDFRQKKPKFIYRGDLHVNKGTLFRSNGEAALSNVIFDVDIDSEEEEYQFSNIGGDIVSSQGIYSISGRYLNIWEDDDGVKVDYDLRVENAVMDLIRLVGSYDGSEKAISLDQSLTECFGTHPKEFSFTLDDKLSLEGLLLDVKMPLEEALSLALFSESLGIKSDLFSFLPKDRSLYTGLVTVKFRVDKGVWHLRIRGDDIGVDSTEIEHLIFEAKGEEGKAEIERFGFDDYLLSGKLEKSEGVWELFDFVCSGPQLSMEFGKGFFDQEKKYGKITLEEGHASMDELFSESGEVSISGEMEMILGNGIKDSIVKGRFKGACDDLSSQGYRLESKGDLEVICTYDRGVVVKDSDFTLSNEKVSLDFSVPALAYSFSNKLIKGYQIKLSMAKSTVEYFSKVLSKEFPSVRSLPYFDGDETSLLLDFSYQKGNVQVAGTLDGGVYIFEGKKYTINGLDFHYDQRHLDFFVKVPLFENIYGVNFSIQPYDTYETIIEAYDISKGDSDQCLCYVEAKLKGPDGLSIQRMEGDFLGFQFEFLPLPKMQDEHSLVFLGSAKIDVDGLLPVVQGDLRAFLEKLKFHKGYELQGELTLVKDSLKESFFEGYLKGRDFDILGYQLSTLLSSIHLNNDGISIRDLKVSDDAVAADIGEMKIAVNSGGEWFFQIPEMKIMDLQPSLLKRRYHSNQKIKPFRIKKMVFQDVSGSLANADSYTGKGNLSFVNTFKKGHNLLDIPLEIISRLGLDMVLLVPIQGEMDYVIKNGKLVFTKLKNSYSENRRSYFFLWNKTESFIDFDGNMHIDIRMKQYVLFKITELFILSLNGSLEHPKVFLK